MRSLYLLVIGLLIPVWVHADVSDFNLTPGVTDISQQVYGLHMTIFYICCGIAAVVFGIMLYSLIKHRKSKGAVPANFHESTKVEILWTVIPFLILIVMAVPATKTLVAMEDPSQSELTIQVTGSQWKWHYKYFDKGVEFFSLLSTPQAQIKDAEAKGENYLLEVDKPLVIPANRKVRFLMTSDDVIHSWWVPAFAVKKDANPGFINEAWTKVDKPGTYRGQCAELCGKDHGFMPVVVEVLAEADFDNWLADQQQAAAEAEAAANASLNETLTMEESMTLGESVYNARCAACHMPNGMGLPGVFPGLKDSPIAKGDIAAHIDIVVNGKPGTAMQAFAAQLTPKEIAAVVTYERNAWGNNMGDIAQPADVAGGGSGSEPNQAEAKTAVEAVEVAEATTEAKAAAPASEASQEPLTMETAMAEGQLVYNTYCGACHMPTGMGLPPTFPALKDSPMVKGDVAAHIDIVLKGKAGTAMQGFSAQLSERQLAAVITYERNAWDNNTGDLVTTADVAASKGQ